MKPEMIEHRSIGFIERICLLSITVVVSVFTFA